MYTYKEPLAFCQHIIYIIFMARPKVYDEVVHFRLDHERRVKLDQVRGDQSKSEWLREKIDWHHKTGRQDKVTCTERMLPTVEVIGLEVSDTHLIVQTEGKKS